MTDWAKLGLKCGLEIHQQLEGEKLFCKCRTDIRDDAAQFTVQRKLRAVAGESGDVDVAALREVGKGKWFTYEGFLDNTCLVELDESPPEELNHAALLTALQVSLLLKMTPVDQLHMMRKTVVDGSNTSGFQRTGLVSQDGSLTTSLGTVTIPTLSIEEDACRIIAHTPDATIYRLDRLGIPLIEIGTGPDIKTPEQAKEVAETLGMLLRSTGKAKRGLGTIRQDINVSIIGGTRIEIKGAQDLKLVPTYIANEAQRQAALLDLKKTLNSLKQPNPALQDLTHVLAKTTSKVIASTIASKGVVMGILLPGFAGLLGKETQPGKRFGTELSDRAKTYAGVGGIFHSDELPNYGITESEVDSLKTALKCGTKDAFVIVATDVERAKRALTAVIERVNEAFHGVPKEVRKANEDGTTSFLRPMPGAARMYPETDIPAIPLPAALVKSIPLPELIEHKVARYEKLGLGHDLAELAAKSEQSTSFERFVKEHPSLKPAYIAETLLGSAKTIQRQFNIEIHPTENDFAALFHALGEGTLSKESVLDVLKSQKPVEQVLSQHRTMSDAELERELLSIIDENKGMAFNALIGKAMAKLRGKAPGQKISTLLQKLAR